MIGCLLCPGCHSSMLMPSQLASSCRSCSSKAPGPAGAQCTVHSWCTAGIPPWTQARGAVRPTPQHACSAWLHHMLAATSALHQTTGIHTAPADGARPSNAYLLQCCRQALAAAIQPAASSQGVLLVAAALQGCRGAREQHADVVAPALLGIWIICGASMAELA